MLMTSPAHAQQVSAYNYAIPSQSLGMALNQLALSSDRQIMVPAELVRGHTAPGLNGHYSLDEALQRMLAGTGLTYEISDAGTVIIKRGLLQKPNHSTKATPVLSTTLQTVTVTGSRIPLTVAQQAVPVHVYTSEEIERSGRTTVADFLNTLSQVSVPSTPGDNQTFANQRSVQLHGLPIGTTLVLINGQRTEISRYGFLDLSVIPVSAIDHIEMIPVGSSAIYGSDALAGVINIVLRKDFDGVEFNAKYGAASGTNDISGNFALDKDWGRGSISAVVNYHSQSALYGSERRLSALGDYRSLGGHDYRVDYCNPGTVYALNGGELPGLGTASAGIPAGIQGRTTIDDFRNTAGAINKCAPYSRYYQIIPPNRQYSALVSAHYQVAPWIDLFADILYSKLKTGAAVGSLLSLSGGSFGNYTVSASNPYNPFGQDVGVSWTYGQRSYDRTTDFFRPVVGARGDLPGDWHWELTALYSQDKQQVLDQAKDAAKIREALASSDPSTALDVFGANPGSADLLRSLYVTNYDRYNESLLSGQAVVRGPLFTLPAGAVQSVFGAARDRLHVWDQLVDLDTESPAANRSRDEWALFTEERVPLIASKDGAEHCEALALSLAARYDHSSDFGGKSTYQGGLEWRPFSSLLLRAAYGTSYRAPQLSDIYDTPGLGYTDTIVDPYRGGQTYDVELSLAPNPNLKPETGHSKSLGLVYSSERFSGLESSLTWWNIEYENYIGTPTDQDVVDFPNRYPAGMVVRGTPAAEDVAKGWLGDITSLTSMPVNFGSLEVAGVDFDASYRIPSLHGTWMPSISLTETYKYEVALSPGEAPYSVVSRANSVPGFAPRWKGNMALNWERHALAASVTARYISAYDDYSPYAPPGHQLGNFWLFDANVHYDVGQRLSANSLLHGAYVSVGGVNIFDRKPQFSYFPYGYDYQQADMRGRFVYVQAGLRL